MVPVNHSSISTAMVVTMCSICHLYVARQGGMMCVSCRDAGVERLGRRVQKLLRQAAVNYQAATDAVYAVYTSMEEANVQTSLREARKAGAICREAWTIVQDAEELVFRMENTLVHTETSVAATAELVQALDKAAEVVELVRNAFAAVAARVIA
ncbi:hypothetical protein QBC45DRAFT_487281 [Copromyces sp. CBS 386.78]|nr:hypothetical protein QBC45DRAFT_487281 [Copromyces sp. CBS 386.78]